MAAPIMSCISCGKDITRNLYVCRDCDERLGLGLWEIADRAGDDRVELVVDFAHLLYLSGEMLNPDRPYEVDLYLPEEGSMLMAHIRDRRMDSKRMQLIMKPCRMGDTCITASIEIGRRTMLVDSLPLALAGAVMKAFYNFEYSEEDSHG